MRANFRLRSRKIITTALCFFLTGNIAYASSLTFQGRITNSQGIPIESSNVEIIVEISSPNSENCLLYREAHSLDMTASAGIFSIQIGTGIRSSAAIDGGFPLSRVFSNKPVAISPLPNCAFGSGYTPNSVDTRKLKISFNEGTGTQTIQAQEISFVPYSIEATQVGGYPADALLRVEGGTTPAFNLAQALELHSLVNGSSTRYAPANSLGGSAFPATSGLSSGQSVRWNGTAWEAFTPATIGAALTSATSLNPALSVSQAAGVLTFNLTVGTSANTVAAGNDARLVNSIQSTTVLGGDLSGTLPNPTVAGLGGRTFSTAAPALGAILQWSQTLNRWQPEALPSCNLNENIYFNSLSGAYACRLIGINANQITAGSLDAGRIPDIDASKITTGTLSSARGGTGQATYTNGQILIGKTDGTLAKANLTAGTNVNITNGDGSITIDVAGAAPTGTAGGDLTGAYPNPTLTTTGVVAGTYPKLTVDGKGRVTAGASLIASDIPNLDIAKITSGILSVPRGGTGHNAYTDGQILIGKTDGSLAKANLAAGANVNITNGDGTITIGVSGTPPTGSAGGDLTGTYPSPTLTTTGVIAGTYPKVTVDTKGRVSAGAALVAADIPNLDIAKITTGTLSTARGGTGQTTYTDGQLLIGKTDGTLGKATLTAGTNVNITNGDGAITIAVTGATPSGAAGGDLTGNYPSPTLTTTGVAAGTYKSVTVDTKGRISAGTNPTSLTGYGITDAITNGGGTPSIQSGLDAGKPTVGTAGRLYLATDTKRLYRDTGTIWDIITSAAGSGGTVTNIITGTGLSGGPISTTGTISLANTAVTPGTYGSATQVGTFVVDAQGRITSAANATITGVAPGGAAGGDLSGTYPSPTLTTTGVTAGTYPKVTVDAKGRVTAGAALAATDIPNLDTAKITTGVFAAARIPAFSGDATSTAGSTALTLANSGVTAGTYPKVTVDAKGRVTAGASLIAADIPNLDAAKITSGTLGTARGGTGQTTYTNGQLLIGKTDGTLGKGTLTAGTNVTITNGDGAITIDVAGAAPTGTAGGVLNGTYPNPGIATGAVTTTHILDGTILNADISASAAIVDTKLATISTAGKVSGAAITSGTIAGTTAINSSGNIQTSGRMIASATSTTTAAVEVQGQILSRVHNAAAATAINWDNGNLQYTTASCGAFTFSNMHDGGSYTLVVRGTVQGTCTFSQASPVAIAAGSFKFVPANAPTISGRETVYTFLRAGANVYVTWITGF